RLVLAINVISFTVVTATPAPSSLVPFTALFRSSHTSVDVQITVMLPPAHKAGAVAGALFVNTGAHPPLVVTEAINAAYAWSISVCVEHTAKVTSLDNVNSKTGAAGTVKVAVVVS